LKRDGRSCESEAGAVRAGRGGKGFEEVEEAGGRLRSGRGYLSACLRQVEPVGADDWEVLNLHAEYLESQLLNCVLAAWVVIGPTPP
jgi:hypothetical protein